MRKPLRGDMPIPLTLPLHFDLRLRMRRRWKRVAVAALALLCAALLAAGFWLPAKAVLASAEVAVGDELTIERPDGARFTYVVSALDVVDSERAEIGLDADENVVVLVTPWPFEAVTVGGSWRYVVTAQQRF